jgi:glucokinase
MTRRAHTAIGVDIGATTIKLSLVDRRGTVVVCGEAPTPRASTAAGIVAGIIRVASAFKRGAPNHSRPVGIGFTVPQYFEGPTWIQRATNNMPALEGFPLYEPLHEAFGDPIALANDVNAAAIGEHRFGCARGSDRFLLMSIGTGSSIGVIIDNRLLDYNWGAAGDAGQIIVDPIGLLRCTCGGRGCLDTVATAPAIRRDALAAISRGEVTSLRSTRGRRGDVSARDVALAASQGDAVAQGILGRAGRFIGIALTTYLHLFRPDTIVLAGGVPQAGEPLMASIRRTMAEIGSPFYLAQLRNLTVSRFPKWAAAIGAATLILEPDRYVRS